MPENRVAFYYPGPTWDDESTIYNSLLFFDGVALLVPDYLRDKQILQSPLLGAELNERGLLHQVDPSKEINADLAAELANSVERFLEATAGRGLPEAWHFNELSWSRMGGDSSPEVAEALLQSLKVKGLARDSEDGFSIPMHPLVRSFMLVGLAQHLRSRVRIPHSVLDPFTDRPDIERSLAELLSAPNTLSEGHVVKMDADTLGIDLTGVPLDEILDFKDDHGEAFRRYSNDVQVFSAALSQVEPAKREGMQMQRRQELSTQIQELEKLVRPTWRKRLGLALGIAGAWWSVEQGDWLGAAAGVGGLTLAGFKGPEPIGAYSYLLEAKRI
jgi:hypothetical protein